MRAGRAVSATWPPAADSSARPNSTEKRICALEDAVKLLMARQDRGGPRDQADMALVAVIGASTRRLSFTTAALWRHRAVDPALADSLTRCDITSPKQLGKLLKRLEARTVNGVEIVCVGVQREGKVWQARVRE